MIDTEGSQIHVVDQGAPSSVKVEGSSIWLFTVQRFEGSHPFTVHANYEGFSEAEDWLKPNVIVDAFEARSARMFVACAQKLAEFANPEEGFLELSADLVEAAVAHCELIVVSKFIEKLQQDIPGKGVKEQLEILCNVYALFLLHKHQGLSQTIVPARKLGLIGSSRGRRCFKGARF